MYRHHDSEPWGGHHRRHRRSRRGQVRLSILKLLAEEPRNGYQLMSEIADRTAGAWRPSPGAAYPALAQLQDEGLVEMIEQDGQRAYQLTESGTQAAAGIESAPWEIMNAEFDEPRTKQSRDLFQALEGLGGAVRELTRNGTLAQLETATNLVADTRRGLYRILADADS